MDGEEQSPTMDPIEDSPDNHINGMDEMEMEGEMDG